MVSWVLDLLHRWRYRNRITESHLAEILAYEDTRGVDLPCWRSPAEIAALRVVEGKQA